MFEFANKKLIIGLLFVIGMIFLWRRSKSKKEKAGSKKGSSKDNTPAEVNSIIDNLIREINEIQDQILIA